MSQTCKNPYLHGCGLEWKDPKEKELFFKKQKKRREARVLTACRVCNLPSHICHHDNDKCECRLCAVDEDEK